MTKRPTTKKLPADEPETSDRSVQHAIARRQEFKKPVNADEYIGYARLWISEAMLFETALAQWTAERDLRDKLQVPIVKRLDLHKSISVKFGASS